MLKDDVKTHFGSYAEVARQLGVGRATVSKWKKLVPPLRAAQLQKLTKGKLKFDPAAYSSWYWKQDASEAPSTG